MQGVKMGCCNIEDDIRNAILKALGNSSEALRAGDIAEKSGLEKDTVTKIISKMKKDVKVISPKRCFYSLP